MYKKDLNNLQWLICHKTQPNHICLIYMFKEGLALNNLQWLLCRNTKPNQTTDRIITSSTTLVQSGPGSNGNEGVLHILVVLVSYPGYLWGKFLPLCRDAVSNCSEVVALLF